MNFSLKSEALERVQSAPAVVKKQAFTYWDSESEINFRKGILYRAEVTRQMGTARSFDV